MRKEINFKFYIYSLIAILTGSCTHGKNDLNGEKQIEIDTILINTDSKVLYLGDNLEFLNYSGLSENKSELYILDPANLKLILIDLTRHNLASVIELEKEGPNGIGSLITGFQVLNDSTFIVKGRNEFFFLNPKGQIVKKISLDHIFYLDDELSKKNL